MRFTSILAGLAFASGALSNPSEKRSITECAFWDTAANPLLPAGTFISSEQEAIFQRLLSGISDDIKSIEQRCTGKQRRTVRKCRVRIQPEVFGQICLTLRSQLMNVVKQTGVLG
jgi:hypothetical protein